MDPFSKEQLVAKRLQNKGHDCRKCDHGIPVGYPENRAFCDLDGVERQAYNGTDCGKFVPKGLREQ